MTTQTTPHHAHLTTRASRLRKTCSLARRVRWDGEPEAGIGGSDVLIIVPIVAGERPDGSRRLSKSHLATCPLSSGNAVGRQGLEP